MRALAARGIELSYSERGEGAPVLLVHETATSSAVFGSLVEALAGRARTIAYDRRGWGATAPPPGYARTTVHEQSEDAATLLEALGAAPAVICGAGLGAAIAVDLILGRSELVTGAVLVEPPLLSLLPEATELLAADRRALEAAAGEGRDALVALYLSGGLGALAAGVERIPGELSVPARERPASLSAELGAVPGWEMPVTRFAQAVRPSLVLTASSTPSVLRAAADALSSRLAGSEHRDLGSCESPPHIGLAREVADLALELVPPNGGVRRGR